MKKTFLNLAVAAPLLAVAFSSFASTATDALKASLAEKYPTSTFNEVNETPVEGIYELVTGKNIFYTDKTGSYLFFGSLYDMKNSHDLTQERKAALNKVAFDTLNLKDAIKEVRGDGSRVFAVFTDPDCPYCKQLETTLKSMENVTIYRFLYPLVSIHPGAELVSKKIWCAGDDTARLAALDGYMLGGGKIPANDGSCENPVSRNVSKGQEFNVNGTPTMIAADGRMHAGASQAPQINAWLDQGAAKSESVAKAQ